MKNAKQWGVAVFIVAVLVAALAYQARNGKVSLVEAKSEIDLSVLRPNNPGCSITAPDGTAMDVSKTTTIPKGTFITFECFGSKKL